jgi:ATP-dependent Lhr-like helicase
MLSTGRHGSSEVGYVDPTVLTGQQDDRLVLLAGRSWRVTEIEWSRRVVWLEPAREGGKARWMGSPRSLGRDVCQGIRTVLTSGAPAIVTLSQRARAALRAFAEDLPMSPGTHFVTVRQDTMRPRTWTFAGTRANRTLAHQASAGGQKVRFDAVSVHAPAAMLIEPAPGPLTLTDIELATFAESVKFAECVPRGLLARTILAREFQTTSPPDFAP